MIKKHHISNPLFKKILKSVPISTVDLVVIRGKGKSREFLLGKRKNKPYSGKWFIPGGRVLWGESLEKAVQRHLKQELGLHSKHFKFVFHYCFNNPPGEMGIRYYTIFHVYEIEMRAGIKASHDEENVELAWYKKIDKTWPMPVKQILKVVGFK